MANGKPTPSKTRNQQEWDRQVKRIKTSIKKLGKIGVDIPITIIPEKPKRITQKSLSGLRKITPKQLKKYATPKYELPQAIKQQKYATTKSKKAKTTTPKLKTTKQATTKSIPNQSTVILDNIRELIRTWSPQPNCTPYFSSVKSKDKDILSNILEGAISQDGEQAVARRLANYATEVMDIVNRILYDSGGKTGRDQTQLDLQRFSAIIMGRRLTVEESKNMTEIAETMNGESTE